MIILSQTYLRIQVLPAQGVNLPMSLPLEYVWKHLFTGFAQKFMLYVKDCCSLSVLSGATTVG